MSEVELSNRINWLNSIFLVSTPLLAIIGAIVHWNYFGHPGWVEFFTFVFMYFACGLSITVGYHRLFSHKSHDAKWPMVLFYSIFGAGAFQNSIIEWASDHRNHHKNTDTGDDPYSAARGFWYSHIGWVMIDEEKFKNDFSNVSDLKESKIIMWQHRNIFSIGAVSGLLLPGLIGYIFAGIAGAIGCFVWAGLVRTVFVHHGTFLINSAAHIWGTQPYSKDNTSRDSFWLAFLTFGEGYHNFHHSFQADYRNGYKWYHVDPSKWWINIFRYMGLKSNLKRTPNHSIEIAKLDMKFSNKIDQLRDNNIDTSNFENRMAQCRDSLRNCLFEIHRAHKELKTVVKSSKNKIRTSISDLQQSLVIIRADLRIIFSDMRKQVISIA